MLKQMQKIIKETCIQMQAELLEFNGGDDHIHMMIHVHPKLAISNLAGKLKGKTSYFMRKIHQNHVKKYLWGNRFWSPSYCVVSCGGAPLDMVKQYIENQRSPTLEKHVKKSKALTRS
jgi:putative transposase